MKKCPSCKSDKVFQEVDIAGRLFLNSDEIVIPPENHINNVYEATTYCACCGHSWNERGR